MVQSHGPCGGSCTAPSLLKTSLKFWYTCRMGVLAVMDGLSTDVVGHGRESTSQRQWCRQCGEHRTSSPTFQDTSGSWYCSHRKPRIIGLTGEEMMKKCYNPT